MEREYKFWIFLVFFAMLGIECFIYFALTKRIKFESKFEPLIYIIIGLIPLLFGWYMSGFSYPIILLMIPLTAVFVYFSLNRK